MTTGSRPGLGASALVVIAAASLFAVAVAVGLQITLALIALPAAASFVYLLWRVDPAYTLSAAILLAPLAGNWQQLHFPSGVDPDRFLLVFGILQVLLRAPAVRDRPPLRLTPAHVLLGLATVYVVVSAFVAKTLFPKTSLFAIIDAFGILPFLVFAVAPVAFRTRRQRGILLVTLVSLGAYLSLTTVFEMIHLDALVFPKYILIPSYGIHYGKGRGPFVDAIANGFALLVCASACGIAIATWSQRRSKVIAGAIAILCFVGTFLTLERSIWIGVPVATLVAMTTSQRLRRYVLPVAVVGALGIGVSLLAISGLSKTVKARAGDLETVWVRQNLTVAALNMLEARPLTGFGWARFQAESKLYFRQSQNYPLVGIQNEPHNFVLLYAVELGLPGLALWLFGVLMGVRSALVTRGPPDLAAWRTALVAVFVMFVVVSNFVPPTLFPNLSLWLFAAVAFSGRYASPRAVDPVFVAERRFATRALRQERTTLPAWPK